MTAEMRDVMKKGMIYLKIVLNFVLFLLTVAFIIFVVPKCIGFFLPFVIAFIISAIANPLVRFMEKKIKIVRKHSSAIIIVLVIGAVVGIIYLLISILVKEIVNLVAEADNILAMLTSGIYAILDKVEEIMSFLPESMTGNMPDVRAQVENYITTELGNITLPSINAFSGYFKSFADFIVVMIMTILASYFLVAERDNISNMLQKIVPKSIIDYYSLIVENFKKAVGGYFKAQFKLMILMLAILFTAFAILRIEYAFLIALLVAILDFLPVFGTGTVLGPWVVIDLLLGNYYRAVFLIIVYAVCQVVKQLLQPKMVGDSIGLSPLATLFFMFVGYKVAGILGMIIGIPIGMILVNFYRIGLFDNLIRGFKVITHDINEFRKF